MYDDGREGETGTRTRGGRERQANARGAGGRERHPHLLGSLYLRLTRLELRLTRLKFAATCYQCHLLLTIQTQTRTNRVGDGDQKRHTDTRTDAHVATHY